MGEWIKCSERLPKLEENYHEDVWVVLKSPDDYYIYSDRPINNFKEEIKRTREEQDLEIVAWMHIPLYEV